MVGSAAWIELDGIQRHEASSEGVSNAIHNTGFHPIIYIYIFMYNHMIHIQNPDWAIYMI
jgi:hypothetical protein